MMVRCPICNERMWLGPEYNSFHRFLVYMYRSTPEDLDFDNPEPGKCPVCCFQWTMLRRNMRPTEINGLMKPGDGRPMLPKAIFGLSRFETYTEFRQFMDARHGRLPPEFVRMLQAEKSKTLKRSARQVRPVCYTCNVSFKNQEYLEIHHQKFHDKRTCGFCGLVIHANRYVKHIDKECNGEHPKWKSHR